MDDEARADAGVLRDGAHGGTEPVAAEPRDGRVADPGAGREVL